MHPADKSDLERLDIENEKLVHQLLEFTSQMESRLDQLYEHQPSETYEEHVAVYNDPELREMMEQLSTKSKRIKDLQHSITEMYKRLESSFKIGNIVEMENKLVNFQRINSELMETISDLNKVKSDQKVRLPNNFRNSSEKLNETRGIMTKWYVSDFNL